MVIIKILNFRNEQKRLKKRNINKISNNNRNYYCGKYYCEQDFYRVDLTKNKSYTLSPISKDIVGNLQDKIVIKAFFSDNLTCAL